MSAFLFGLTSKHRHKQYWRNNCLHGFSPEEHLKHHIDDFCKNSLQKIILPHKKHQWIEFTAIEKMLPMPFVIYADFESFLELLKVQ